MHLEEVPNSAQDLKIGTVNCCGLLGYSAQPVLQAEVVAMHFLVLSTHLGRVGVTGLAKARCCSAGCGGGCARLRASGVVMASLDDKCYGTADEVVQEARVGRVQQATSDAFGDQCDTY